MTPKLYICKECGKMVAVLKESCCPTKCCGEAMVELVPNTTDAAQEKHVPVLEVKGNLVKVSVGSVAHPMAEDHYIEWIALATEKGMQRKALKPGEAPVAEFALTSDDKAVAAYAYCNKHGLWKKEA